MKILVENKTRGTGIVIGKDGNDWFDGAVARAIKECRRLGFLKDGDQWSASRVKETPAKPLAVWEDYGEGEGTDSYTQYRVYPATLTRDQIRADFDSPDGTGRCQCQHCQNGWDCCGNWSASAVYFPNVRIGSGILVQQSWVCNV